MEFSIVSNIQLIKVGEGKTVVRYYNAEKDCFVRICKAKDVSVRALPDTENKLIVADEQVWVLWDDRLHFVYSKNAETMLCEETWRENHSLKKYDLSQTPLPFNHLFVYLVDKEIKDWAAVRSYEATGKSQVKIVEYPSEQKSTFMLSFSEDELFFVAIARIKC